MTPLSHDRRQIAPLLVRHFPKLVDTERHAYTSDEWHGFLNAQTGLAVALDTPNSVAFDQWRRALTAQGYDVGFPTPGRVAQIKRRGEELAAKEAVRVAALPATLAKLRDAAPGKEPAEREETRLA